jgi:hypothetical protein
MGFRLLEHFSVKRPRFTVKNAPEEQLHFSVKWPRFTVKNAASTKSRAGSVMTEPAPGRAAQRRGASHTS